MHLGGGVSWDLKLCHHFDTYLSDQAKIQKYVIHYKSSQYFSQGLLIKGLKRNCVGVPFMNCSKCQMLGNGGPRF